MLVRRLVAPLLFAALVTGCGAAPESAADPVDEGQAPSLPSPIGRWVPDADRSTAANQVAGGALDPEVEGGSLSAAAMQEILAHFWMDFADDGTVRIATQPGSEQAEFLGHWTIDGVDLTIVVEGQEDDGPDRIYFDEEGLLILADDAESGSAWTMVLRRAD